MKQIQHQTRLTTLPVPTAATNTNAGIPWMVAWTPPFFPKKMPSQLMQTEMEVLTPNTLPAGISGIAWMKGWEPPYFPLRVKPELMQSEMEVLTPDTLPVPNSGLSWWRPFDQPDQRKVPVQLIPTEAKTLYPGSLPPPISGHAWNRKWEDPYFPKRVKIELMQTQAFPTPPSTLPTKIAGMAWRVAWELPTYKCYDQFGLQFNFRVNFIPSNVPSAWWYAPFDQPKQVKVPVELQMTTVQTLRPYPYQFARGYIIGPA